MEKFEVKEEHLVGQIADFPLHVVQAMVDEQVRQGNKADPSVFAERDNADRYEGGFAWCYSTLGAGIWYRVISLKQFDCIPKPEKPKGHVHAKLMKQYAKDAKVSATPWELWEHRSIPHGTWRDCTVNPAWIGNMEYRRKIETQAEPEKERPTPNEITKALLKKDMVVWGSCSDYSYQNARDVAKVQLSKIVKDSSGGIKNAEGKCWKYAVPIDPKTMTEITEVPK